MDSNFNDIPKHLFEYAGLTEFWELFSLAINLSGFEVVNMGKKVFVYPTVGMISEIGATFIIPMIDHEFWTATNNSLGRMRQHINQKAG